MVHGHDISSNPLLDAEFDKAFELLGELVDLRRADEIQPCWPSTVYTTSVVLWLLVYQRMHAGASMEEAVKHFLQSPPSFCPDNKRVREKTLSTCTAAYSDGRQRTTLEVTEWFANEVSKSIIDASPPSLGQQRVFLIDGTTIALPPIQGLQELFPPASNQYGEGVWPIVNLVVAHELESGAALLPVIGPMYGQEAISETSLVGAIVEQLPTESIVMADAGFGIFYVAYTIHEGQQDFLLRMTASRFNALRRKATLTAEGIGWKTYSHHWTPSAKERKKHPEIPADAYLDVYLHEIMIHNDLTLMLVTGLTNSGVALASLYGKRVDVEIDIRNVKVTLDTENIRAETVEMFRKELMTSMVSYNLVAQFRRQAAELAGVAPRELSFTRVWTTYRIFLMNAMHTEPAKWRESYWTALRYAMRDRLQKRPGRSFKREAYPKRHKSSQFKKRKKPKKNEDDNKQNA
jgi:hypothetical protein